MNSAGAKKRLAVFLYIRVIKIIRENAMIKSCFCNCVREYFVVYYTRLKAEKSARFAFLHAKKRLSKPICSAKRIKGNKKDKINP